MASPTHPHAQVLLQVQGQSSLPGDQRYRGVLDALRRIPAREGGWRVGALPSAAACWCCGVGIGGGACQPCVVLALVLVGGAEPPAQHALCGAPSGRAGASLWCRPVWKGQPRMILACQSPNLCVRLCLLAACGTALLFVPPPCASAGLTCLLLGVTA